MSFPSYPKYKDSGVKWLGEVPEHWDVRRLKHVSEVFPSNVDKKTYQNEPPVLLCNYTNVYYNDLITSKIDFMAASASNEQVKKFSLRAGDTIITKDSETADEIAIAAYVPNDLPGVICGYHLSMVRPYEATYGGFVKRLFDSIYVKSCCAVSANGLTRVGLGQSALDNLEIPFPPKKEQQSIAAFLDRETAKIDALIAEQQRLIDLLKEKRRAVISHAVTKGLSLPSPSGRGAGGEGVPLKDSGIEWLGEVPAHWAIKKLKYLVAKEAGIQMGPFGGMLLDLEVEDTGYKVYGQENTISGDFSAGNRWISESRFASLSRYHLLTGDIVMTRKGSLGNSRLIIDLPQPGIIDSDTIKVRVNESLIQPKFLALLLHEAQYISTQIMLFKRGAILSGINSNTIANLTVVLPPKNEQVALIKSIKHRVQLLDSGISESEKAIELLKERRTALISAAVTGKIDVRSIPIKQP